MDWVKKLKMNEVELAAWACVLLRTLQPQASPEANSSDLVMSAYHIKSLLCTDMTPFYHLSITDDQFFPEKYLSWLAMHPGLHTPSLEELHRRLKGMSLRCEEKRRNDSYNLIVDSLVEAKEQLTEEGDTDEENDSYLDMPEYQHPESDQFPVKTNEEDCPLNESLYPKYSNPHEMCDFDLISLL